MLEMFLEFIVDLVTELVWEGGLDTAANPKLCKPLRFLILGLFILFIVAISGFCIFLGVIISASTISDGNFSWEILISLFLFVLGILFPIQTAKQIRTRYMENLAKISEENQKEHL